MMKVAETGASGGQGMRHSRRAQSPSQMGSQPGEVHLVASEPPSGQEAPRAPRPTPPATAILPRARNRRPAPRAPPLPRPPRPPPRPMGAPAPQRARVRAPARGHPPPRPYVPLFGLTAPTVPPLRSLASNSALLLPKGSPSPS